MEQYHLFIYCREFVLLSFLLLDNIESRQYCNIIILLYYNIYLLVVKGYLYSDICMSKDKQCLEMVQKIY